MGRHFPPPKKRLTTATEQTYAFTVANGGALEFSLSVLSTGTSNPVRGARGTIVVQSEAPVVMRWFNASYFHAQTVRFSAEVAEPLGLTLFPSSERAIALIVHEHELADALCAKYGFQRAAPDETRQSATQSGRRFIIFPSLESARGVVARALPVASEDELRQRFASLHAHIVADVRNEKPVDIVLGTMMFGQHEKLPPKACRAQLDAFAAVGDEIDTARV